MHRGLWLVAATGIFASCSSYSATPDDGSTDVDASSNTDASPSEAGASDALAGAVSDAGDGGRTNLLANPGFEESLGSGCTAWTVIGGTAVLSDVARTGAHSCLVCPSTADLAYVGLAQFDVGADAAASYYAEVWVHAPPTGGPTPNAGVVVYESLPDGGQSNHQGSFAQPGAAWSLSTVTANVAAGDKIEFEVHGYFPDGGCALVDDAALYAR